MYRYMGILFDSVSLNLSSTLFEFQRPIGGRLFLFTYYVFMLYYSFVSTLGSHG